MMRAACSIGMNSCSAWWLRASSASNCGCRRPIRSGRRWSSRSCVRIAAAACNGCSTAISNWRVRWAWACTWAANSCCSCRSARYPKASWWLHLPRPAATGTHNSWAATSLCWASVQATPSHPDAVPMGWDAFAELRAQVSLPIYALGGMGRSHIAEARRHGARASPLFAGCGWRKAASVAGIARRYPVEWKQ